MIGFLIGVLLLAVLAGAILLWRGQDTPRSADASDPNLGWYAQREAELRGQDEALLDDARLRLLEDASDPVGGPPNASPGAASNGLSTAISDGRKLGFLLLVVVLVISGLVYQQTGSIEDVLIYDALAELTPQDSDATRDALLARIAARSRAQEDNIQYLGLLGQLYMAQEAYALASEAFGRLAEKAPEDPQALAMAAQSRFLAADRQLDTQAQLLAEKALAVDPAQRTALGLLGMSSFEGGAYAAAINYWGRLQAQEEPGSPGYDMLDQVMGVARERGGLQADAGGAKDVVASAAGISVSLSLPENHSASPQAVVFVFARRAGSAGGMPIA
ncbi:MAG: cytochrome C biogenesis protein, partial [Congregibacter sp.]|nr:cytochrome C biogenesis protein [Congregibacter sp.]